MAVKENKDEVELTDDQIQLVNEFMKTHPEVERRVALKFNLGRKFVAERVEECYRNYQKTVLDHHFESVTVADVLEELHTQKLYIPGTRDRNGAALFIINAGKHVPGQYPNEQTLKLAFYLGEVLTASQKTSQIGVTIISNMEGMEWANFDNQFQRSIIDFFQANIPARVKNIVLYKSPWWVSMLVRMVSPFLKQKMRERIHICEEGDLQQFIESDQLPKDLGGTFAYDHDAFIKKEMAKVPSGTMIRSGRASPVPPGGAEGEEEYREPPPGTIMLISDELAQALNEERQKVLADLDEKIRRRRESLQRHTLPLDITKLVRSKSARMSLDLTALPNLEPNLLHLRDARLEGQQPSILIGTEVSPLAERPGEDYAPEKLEERIAKSIRKDRTEYLKKMRRHAQVSGMSTASSHYVDEDEEEQDEVESQVSFTPAEEAKEVAPVPVMPEAKTQFSTLVSVPRSQSPDKVEQPSVVPMSSIDLEDDDDDDDEEEEEEGGQEEGVTPTGEEQQVPMFDGFQLGQVKRKSRRSEATSTTSPAMDIAQLGPVKRKSRRAANANANATEEVVTPAESQPQRRSRRTATMADPPPGQDTPKRRSRRGEESAIGTGTEDPNRRRRRTTIVAPNDPPIFAEPQ